MKIRLLRTVADTTPDPVTSLVQTETSEPDSIIPVAFRMTNPKRKNEGKQTMILFYCRRLSIYL